MSGRFTGKVAIITGASRGIGLSVAQRLVDDGARVCLTARKQSALDKAVETLGGPSKAIAEAGRADDPTHQETTVKRVLAEFGAVDMLVNNAGINPSYSPLVDVDLAAARKTFEVNSLAAVGWVQQVHRNWMAENNGVIVNISSLAATLPAPGMGFYGGSKAMLNRLTQQLALEMGPHVRVNGVVPGLVKTRFAEALFDSREEELAKEYPLGRLGEPDDIANAVAFLLSPEAAWMTGQLIVVDGGSSLIGQG